MGRRASCTLAILIAALMSLIAGCSSDVPTSSSVSRMGRGGDGAPVRSAGNVEMIMVPDAAGTVRRFPEMGILDIAPVSSEVQSFYFRTTDTNREFRRGLAEFVVPEFADGFSSARIVLRETRGTIGQPVPPDRHELSSYSRADLRVDPSDFERSTSPIAAFETDANLEQGTFDFDVTRVLAGSTGSSLGFQIKLARDPSEAGTRFLGSGFSRFSTPPGITIVVAGVSGADAGDYLQHRIRGLQLKADVEARLINPLRQAVRVLRDNMPGNDVEACAELQAFLDLVAAQEADGGVSDLQAADLKDAALRIATGIGCAE